MPLLYWVQRTTAEPPKGFALLSDIICRYLNLANFSKTCSLREGEAPKGRDHEFSRSKQN